MAKKKRKIGKIKPAPYTGLVGARQGFTPKNPMAQQYGGGSVSTSQGGIKPQEQSGGGLQDMLAMKESYDQVGEMYKSGEDLQKGILGLPEKAGNAMDYVGDRYDDIATPVSDWWNDTNTLRSVDQLPQGGAGFQYPSWDRTLDAQGKVSGLGNISPTSGISMGIGSSPAQNVANTFGLRGSSPVLGTQMNAGQMGLEPMAGQWGSSGMTQGLQDAVMRSGDVSMATQLGPSGGLTADGLQATGAGLQNTSKAAIDAGAAEASMLSKAGSIAGLGLNAYDMFENGVTANNAMGLAGSGIMAGTTMLGLSNAWNPLGWGLLGASAIGGLTDWW